VASHPRFEKAEVAGREGVLGRGLCVAADADLLDSGKNCPGICGTEEETLTTASLDSLPRKVLHIFDEDN
jgi:hypothetical protein